MTLSRSYLDYNAAAPLRAEAKAAMLACMDSVGNPSSVHAEGRAARAQVETARRQVAELCGAKPAEVILTSGATEAANWVLSGPWRVIFASRLEHVCIADAAAASGARVIEIPVAADGRVDVEATKAILARHAIDAGGSPGASLVVLQAANNETGIVQPVAEIAALAHARGLGLLVDAVQAVGRIAVDRDALGADFLLLSSHKIGGPKGVGAMVLREGRDVRPLLVGGGQERRRRAGTENVEGIVGFGAAAQAARLAREAESVRLAGLRDRLEREALAIAPSAVVIGRDAPRLPNTTCLALAGSRAETLVIKLDLAGVAVSAGAACSSGKVGESRVLAAMGLAPEVARAAIRVSIGHATTSGDIERFLDAWRGAVAVRPATTVARNRPAPRQATNAEVAAR